MPSRQKIAVSSSITSITEANRRRPNCSFAPSAKPASESWFASVADGLTWVNTFANTLSTTAVARCLRLLASKCKASELAPLHLTPRRVPCSPRALRHILPLAGPPPPGPSLCLVPDPLHRLTSARRDQAPMHPISPVLVQSPPAICILSLRLHLPSPL